MLTVPLAVTLVLFGVCKNLFLKHTYGAGAETQEGLREGASSLQSGRTPSGVTVHADVDVVVRVAPGYCCGCF